MGSNFMYAKILLMTAVLLSGQIYAQSTTTTTPVAKTNAKVKKKKKDAKAAVTTTTVSPVAEITPTEEIKKEEAKPLEVAKAIDPLAVEGLSAFQYLKEKFSATYHGEYYFTRRDVDSTNDNDHDIQDLKIMHNPTVIYKPTKNWQILATAEFKYTDAPKPGAGTFVNDYYRSLFTVTRKNILIEQESGFQLDAGIGRRDFNTRTNPQNFGNSRVFTTITKTYGKNNGSLFVQYLYNDPNISTSKNWKHSLELIPTINIELTEKLSYLFNDDISIYTPIFKNPNHDVIVTHEMNLAYLSYKWTDKINSYYQLKYYHAEEFSNEPKDDYNEHYIGLTYAFTPKISLTTEIGSEIFHAHDRKSFFAKKASYPEFQFYLDMAI